MAKAPNSSFEVKKMEYPVIKEWHLSFLDETSDERRQESEGQIIRFARENFASTILAIDPCYSLVGREFSDKFPDGRYIMTQVIVRYERVDTRTLALITTEPDEKALIAQTQRGDKYYLIINKRFEAQV